MLGDAIDALFRPFGCCEMRLASSTVMAPMARYLSLDGVPGPGVADY